MEYVIYVSSKMKEIIEKAEIIVDPELSSGEIYLIDPSQVYKAVSKGKIQIPTGKTCLKYVAEEEGRKVFFREPKEIVERPVEEEKGVI
ncbi:MAG: hypothetical protein ACTSXD_02120 [Candidatus Heimdallarchaeaceae archaeon]